jgi:hypothetical protein
MREIIEPGVTGFLADGLESAAAAVSLSAGLDRAAIREVAVRRFGASRMVDDYLAVYERMLAAP